MHTKIACLSTVMINKISTRGEDLGLVYQTSPSIYLPILISLPIPTPRRIPHPIPLCMHGRTSTPSPIHVIWSTLSVPPSIRSRWTIVQPTTASIRRYVGIFRSPYLSRVMRWSSSRRPMSWWAIHVIRRRRMLASPVRICPFGTRIDVMGRWRSWWQAEVALR